MKIAILIILALLFTSCATLLNAPAQTIEISTDKKIAALFLDSSIHTIGVSNKFTVLRRKKPLILFAEIDGSNIPVKIKSHLSAAYWANLYFYGVGMLIDRHKPQRYAYPKHMYLSYKDSVIKKARFAPIRKGTFSFNFSLPHFNFYYVRTDRDHYSNAGFIGIESGFDYYYKDNKYLSLNIGGAENFPIPIIAPVRFPNDYQFCYVSFINLRNNYCLGRFDLGYGINLSRLVWQQHNSSDSSAKIKNHTSSGLGLSLNAQFKFTNHFRMGILYQPNFIQFNAKPEIDYQHYISIEFIWKFALYKPKEK